MPSLTGAIHGFYLFDVAETIDLKALSQMFGAKASAATLYDKAPGPPRIRYIQPPIVIDGLALDESQLEGFQVRVKFFDYGVVSLALTRPFAGSWGDLVALGQDLIESEPLGQRAEEACRRIVGRVRECLQDVRSAFLDEEYLAFVITTADPPIDADRLLEQYGGEIAQLLRGERQALSAQERDETLRHRLSYLTDDLVIPAWNAALVYDTDAGAASTLEILEFANSQLLEFRYHDERLEAELGRIYTRLQNPRWADRFIGRRNLRATRQLHSLLIDVNELTDRTENALKLAGDLYTARLFGLVAARLGLDQWKHNVQDKLKTLDDIYRFAVEQTRVSQGNILELMIVLILIFELAFALPEMLGF
jgi:hypothetical protein